MKLITYLVIISLSFFSINAAFAEPEFTSRLWMKYDQTTVDKAFVVVRKNCSPLLDKYLSDIKSVSATVHEQYMGFDKKLKRNVQIDFEVRQVDKPKSIPPVVNGNVSVGHVCHIAAYGGTNPGLFISKEVCQALCGAKPSKSGEDVWVPVNDLRFIDPPV
ncbi:MAG: hypothetical protein HQL45_14110 [Alphaproteobacteria bacterium]|nr:hypothetical protein [Alphaproteobacteria bacterium]